MKLIKNLYLVDDDEIFIYLTTRVINETKLVENILVFQDGEYALKALRDAIDNKCPFPDILFLDLSMPVMDGWGVLDELRFMLPQMHKTVKIYLLTSSIATHDYERSKTYSFVADYLIKPLKKDKLIDVFTEYLKDSLISSLR